MALLGYWPPLAHLAVVAACAATGWWRLETAPAAPSGGPVLADPGTPPEESAGAPVDAAARDWQADVEAVASRALFRPGRLATADAAAPAGAAAPAPVGPGPEEAPADLAPLRMVGFLDQGGRRSAILQTLDDGQSHVVREGDEIAGARVREIGPGAVVVEVAGRRVTIELYPD
ncbi:hypothetical protein [Rubellimicrobium aerolatum]|uniref:Type II secretion system protein GspC N-terminal domain-containing protein n=1 Tax=Rubellimicrobium aerolatum TaxID=490979 RepID=A0ABW0SCK4_9RHOB|nr:hypothetical protein [Rubellimicrobium aerolatum]MBP1806170.1 hypothetical protein [Rubellimicrobium aerolatum]